MNIRINDTVDKSKYKDYCLNCEDDNIKPMSYDQWTKHYNPNPDELPRWKRSRSAPTLWDKIRKDPVFEYTLKSRIGDGDDFPESPSMGNRKMAYIKR